MVNFVVYSCIQRSPETTASTYGRFKTNRMPYLLRSIERWADNLSSNQNVLWLHGLAGVGKSTLSTTLANRLLLAGQLGILCFRLSTSTPSYAVLQARSCSSIE